LRLRVQPAKVLFEPVYEGAAQFGCVRGQGLHFAFEHALAQRVVQVARARRFAAQAYAHLAQTTAALHFGDRHSLDVEGK